MTKIVVSSLDTNSIVIKEKKYSVFNLETRKLASVVITAVTSEGAGLSPQKVLVYPRVLQLVNANA
jgi:hypothetical protein